MSRREGMFRGRVRGLAGSEEADDIVTGALVQVSPPSRLSAGVSGAARGDAARTSVPLPGDRATMEMKTQG